MSNPRTPPLRLWCVEIDPDRPTTVRAWIGRLYFESMWSSADLARNVAERIARDNGMRRRPAKYGAQWMVGKARRPKILQMIAGHPLRPAQVSAARWLAEIRNEVRASTFDWPKIAEALEQHRDPKRSQGNSAVRAMAKIVTVLREVPR